MDVAAASMNMSAMNLQMSAGISMAKKTMDVQEVAMQGILKMMTPSPSGLGATLDVMA